MFFLRSPLLIVTLYILNETTKGDGVGGVFAILQPIFLWLILIHCGPLITLVSFSIHILMFFFRYNVCSNCIIRSFRDSVSFCYLQQYLQCYSGLDAWVLLPFDVRNNPHPNILNDVSCIYNTSKIMMIIIIIIAIRKFSNLIGYQLPWFQP